MARRDTKVLRARKDESAMLDDDSLLVRSAESLGRVIGSLQRQVRGSAKRVASAAADATERLPDVPRFDGLDSAGGSARKRAGARKTARRRTSGPSSKKAARKTAGARAATGARKTAGARKRAGSKSASKKR